jgi:hypothetical protein
MKRSVLALALLTIVSGCHRDPAYTLPTGGATVGVQLVQAMPGTIDLGGDTTELCVIQSIAQFGSPSAASGQPSDGGGADDAGDVDAGAASPSAIAQVDLYFDSISETWHLATSGPVNATIACAPWWAFGGPADLTRFDNGGGNPYLFGGYSNSMPTQTVGTDGQTQCFLSDIEGDFVADGNAAAIDGASLTVSNPGPTGGAIYASATCFDGAQAVAYRDFPVDAVTGSLSVPVLPDSRALCGLSALGSLASSSSSLVISQGRALGFRAYGVVRCFLYEVSDAGDGG